MTQSPTYRYGLRNDCRTKYGIPSYDFDKFNVIPVYACPSPKVENKPALPKVTLTRKEMLDFIKAKLAELNDREKLGIAQDIIEELNEE